MPTREPAAWRQSSSFNKVAVFFDLDNEKSAQPKGVKSFRLFFVRLGVLISKGAALAAPLGSLTITRMLLADGMLLS